MSSPEAGNVRLGSKPEKLNARIAVIDCGSTAPVSCLNLVLRLWSIAYASELDPVDCAGRP